MEGWARARQHRIQQDVGHRRGHGGVGDVHPDGDRGRSAATPSRSRCARADGRSKAIYDRSVRRWRHLDLAGVEAVVGGRDPPPVDCRRCGGCAPRSVPWARPGARHTRDVQDVVAFMAQRMDKTTITRLLRVSWEAVAAIVIDVVADQLDTARLDGLFRIGVDEVSYRKGHRYLTVVADHDRDGAVVWAGEGKRRQDAGGVLRRARRASAAPSWRRCRWTWAAPTRRPPTATRRQARQCVDPFHLVKLANEAVDKTRRGWYLNADTVHRRHGRSGITAADPARWVKQTRWALLKDPDRPDRLPARRAPRAAPQPLRALPLLATQRRRCATYTGWPAPPTPPSTSTGGWPGPAAAASPPSSPSPRPSAPTATASSPPSSSACRTRSSKASTARSA